MPFKLSPRTNALARPTSNVNSAALFDATDRDEPEDGIPNNAPRPVVDDDDPRFAASARSVSARSSKLTYSVKVNDDDVDVNAAAADVDGSSADDAPASQDFIASYVDIPRRAQRVRRPTRRVDDIIIIMMLRDAECGVAVRHSPACARSYRVDDTTAPRASNG